jgi:nitroreductase
MTHGMAIAEDGLVDDVPVRFGLCMPLPRLAIAPATRGRPGTTRRFYVDHQRLASAPMDAILSRTNVRNYSEQTVSHESVRKLLEAAMAAHSAGDERPWHFVVVEDAGTRERIADIHPFAHMVPQAPAAIFVCGDPTLQKHSGFWVQDCAAATENILIEAHSLGLGAVWLGIYPVEGRVQNFRKLLGLPPHVIPFALTPVGYPAEQNSPQWRYDESRVHFGRW